MKMKCHHELESGSYYLFRHIGSCDECGCPHEFGMIIGEYIGECLGGHYFRLVSPFNCLGCGNIVATVTEICGGIDVTQEMESIKAH